MNLVDKEDQSDEWSQYERSLNMTVRMKYSSTWTKRETTAYHFSFFISETSESNVNLVVELLLEEWISLEEYANAAKDKIIEQGFEIIESSSADFTQVPAWFITYKKEDEGINVKGMQMMRIHDDKVILLTYTSFPEQFSTHIEKAKEMFNSLEFSSQ